MIIPRNFANKPKSKTTKRRVTNPKMQQTVWKNRGNFCPQTVYYLEEGTTL